MTLSELIKDIDGLIADAGQEEPDSEARKALIKKASAKACLFFTELSREAGELVRKVLDQTELKSEGETLRVAQLMYSNEELRPFTDEGALRAFVDSISGLMEKRGIDRDALNEWKETLCELLPDIREEKVDVTELVEKFSWLKQTFCNPPREGGQNAGKKPPRTPRGGGDALSKWERRLKFLKTAAVTGATIVGIFWPHRPAHPEQPPTHTPDQPPLHAPAVLQLMAILAIAAFASSLKAEGFVPAEVETRELVEA